MPRSKRGKTKKKRKKKVKKQAKGYRLGRKSKYKSAKEALMHAWSYQYRDRRKKKSEFRKKWQTQINAACRQNDTTYSKFIHKLKENNIKLNRKMLAYLARERSEVFSQLVTQVK